MVTGTLQEVMIVERHIREIMPDILILQVCQNDFINNSFELESKSYFNNNNLLRPYLGSDGTITMQIAQPPFRRAVLWAASYSRFLLWVITRFDNWMAVNKLGGRGGGKRGGGGGGRGGERGRGGEEGGGGGESRKGEGGGGGGGGGGRGGRGGEGGGAGYREDANR